MTPEKLQPNLEKKSYSLEIFSPTQKDFEILSIEKLHELWQENHEKLKKILYDSNPPYFGLHGTNQENFKQMETMKECFVEIATFYEKEYKSEQFLYKLYHAALYVSNYANRKQPGRIMVFDLENNGKNMTLPWERLYPGNSLPMTLDLDSGEEEKHFSKLEKAPKENDNDCGLLFRSTLSLGDQKFKESFIGTIDFSDDKLKKYVSKPHDFVRLILSNRFLSQEIISRTLNLLQNRNLSNQ